MSCPVDGHCLSRRWARSALPAACARWQGFELSLWRLLHMHAAAHGVYAVSVQTFDPRPQTAAGQYTSTQPGSRLLCPGTAAPRDVPGPSTAPSDVPARSPQPEQQQQQQQQQRSAASAPLSAVVTDAVRRWYLETSKEAAKGDVVRATSTGCVTRQSDAHTGCLHAQKQQALVGQMLIEGYGCKADPAAAREWTGACCLCAAGCCALQTAEACPAADAARRRGYKMSGVYCEL